MGGGNGEEGWDGGPGIRVRVSVCGERGSVRIFALGHEGSAG